MSEKIPSDLDDYGDYSEPFDEDFLRERGDPQEKSRRKTELRRKMEARLEQKRLSDLLGFDISEDDLA